MNKVSTVCLMEKRGVNVPGMAYDVYVGKQLKRPISIVALIALLASGIYVLSLMHDIQSVSTEIALPSVKLGIPIGFPLKNSVVRTSGELPPGVQVGVITKEPGSGYYEISGTPLAVGTYHFSIEYKIGNDVKSEMYALTVLPYAGNTTNVTRVSLLLNSDLKMKDYQ